jgi:hypothetical protein
MEENKVTEHYGEGPFKLTMRAPIQNKHKYAELKWGQIVSINEHEVDLDTFKRFFMPDAQFIDIMGLKTQEGDEPQLGDNLRQEGANLIITRNSWDAPLHWIARQKIDLLKLEKNKSDEQPIVYNQNSYDADFISRMRISTQANLLESNPIQWHCSNDICATLTPKDFQQIIDALGKRDIAHNKEYNKKKDFLNTNFVEKQEGFRENHREGYRNFISSIQLKDDYKELNSKLMELDNKYKSAPSPSEGISEKPNTEVK